jgi:hypothetical protein
VDSSKGEAELNRNFSSGRNRLQPLGAGFRRASEGACGLPSLMSRPLGLPVNSATADFVAVVETMLSEPENVSASFYLRAKKENARESQEACAK